MFEYLHQSIDRLKKSSFLKYSSIVGSHDQICTRLLAFGSLRISTFCIKIHDGTYILFPNKALGGNDPLILISRVYTRAKYCDVNGCEQMVRKLYFSTNIMNSEQIVEGLGLSSANLITSLQSFIGSMKRNLIREFRQMYL